MSRSKTGNIVNRNGHLYARVTYMGHDGKRHGIWRAAKNMTHARQLIPQIIQMIGDHRGRPRQPRLRGFIYAVRMEVPSAPAPPIKIGFAVDVRERVKALLTGSPYSITILGYWETANGQLEEKTLHDQFRTTHMRGEWFGSSDEILTEVAKRTNAYRARLEQQAREITNLNVLCSEFVTGKAEKF